MGEDELLLAHFYFEKLKGNQQSRLSDAYRLFDVLDKTVQRQLKILQVRYRAARSTRHVGHFDFDESSWWKYFSATPYIDFASNIEMGRWANTFIGDIRDNWLGDFFLMKESIERCVDVCGPLHDMKGLMSLCMALMTELYEIHKYRGITPSAGYGTAWAPEGRTLYVNGELSRAMSQPRGSETEFHGRYVPMYEPMNRAAILPFFPNSKEWKYDETKDSAAHPKSQTNQPRKNLYFVDFQVNDVFEGRVVIKIYPQHAPILSANFAHLCRANTDKSYKGCVVFSCWKNDSIITGDVDNNDGTGGQVLFPNNYDDYDNPFLPPVRGAVGVRKLNKHKGKLNSQFKIMLNVRELVHGIFGQVISGMEIIDTIASLGDIHGKPTKHVQIVNCGEL